MKKLNLGVTVISVALMVLGFGIVARFAFAADKVPASNELMIADFNTGDKPNNIGGDFGAWD